MSEIDVSKCEFYYTVNTKPLCSIGADDARYDDECMKNPNCYYKQLQQLKAENEELKAQIKSNSFGMFNIQMAQCLDDIEEMCKHDCEYECSNDSSKCGICSCLEQRIQRKIKQAKEGGE